MYRAREGMARRVGTPSVDHLNITNVRRTSGRSFPARLKAVMEQACLTALAPPIVWRGGPEGASVVLRTREKGLLLLSPSGGWVRRSSATTPFSAQYEALRRSISAHVAASTLLEVSGDGRVTTEEYVSGSHLSRLPLDDQVTTIRQFIVSLNGLIRSEGSGSSHDYLDRCLDRAHESAIPDDLRRVLDRDRAHGLLGSAPLVPSHGDVVIGNLVVTDNGPILIDWDPEILGTRPFWVDALRPLCAQNTRVTHQFRAGTFDEELTNLWATSGRPAPDLEQHRDVVAAVCHVTFCDYLYPRTPQSDLVSDRTYLAAVNEHWDSWRNSGTE